MTSGLASLNTSSRRNVQPREGNPKRFRSEVARVWADADRRGVRWRDWASETDYRRGIGYQKLNRAVTEA